MLLGLLLKRRKRRHTVHGHVISSHMISPLTFSRGLFIECFVAGSHICHLSLLWVLRRSVYWQLRSKLPEDLHLRDLSEHEYDNRPT